MKFLALVILLSGIALAANRIMKVTETHMMNTGKGTLYSAVLKQGDVTMSLRCLAKLPNGKRSPDCRMLIVGETYNVIEIPNNAGWYVVTARDGSHYAVMQLESASNDK